MSPAQSHDHFLGWPSQKRGSPSFCVLGPRTPSRRRAREEPCQCRGAMDGEAGGAPEVHRSPAPRDSRFYATDPYDPEDRLQPFPEEHTRPGRHVPAEMTSEPAGAAPGEAQGDLEEEVEELEDAYAPRGGGEWGARRAEVPEPRLHLPAAGAQWDARPGAEAEDAGWDAASQALREAYRHAHGRASEEYECYVIPEEEDEDEAALGFCVTCRAPVRASEVPGARGEHEVTPLSQALESAKVNGLPSCPECVCVSGTRNGPPTEERKEHSCPPGILCFPGRNSQKHVQTGKADYRDGEFCKSLGGGFHHSGGKSRCGDAVRHAWLPPWLGQQLRLMGVREPPPLALSPAFPRDLGHITPLEPVTGPHSLLNQKLPRGGRVSSLYPQSRLGGGVLHGPDWTRHPSLLISPAGVCFS